MRVMGSGRPARAGGLADGVGLSCPLHHLPPRRFSRTMAWQCRHLVAAGGLPLLPGGGGIGIGVSGGGLLTVGRRFLYG